MSTVHASCVRFDGRGVLIRGASGAGKSTLAHMLLMRAPAFGLTARLVADDRVALDMRAGRLHARAPETLAGLLEVRGLGLVRYEHLGETPLDLVLDLVPPADMPRLPDEAELSVCLQGVTLPRVFAASPARALDVLLTVNGHSGALSTVTASCVGKI